MILAVKVYFYPYNNFDSSSLLSFDRYCSLVSFFLARIEGEAQCAVVGEVHGVHAHIEEAGAGFDASRRHVGASVHAGQVRTRLGLMGHGRGAGFDIGSGNAGAGVHAGRGCASSDSSGKDVPFASS